MTQLLLGVFGLALVDSINPSAIAVTLYLLTQPNARVRVLVYMSAVYLVYFGLGVVLMLGFGAVLQQLGAAFEHPAVYVAQGILGAGMLLYSFRTVNTKRPPRALPLPRSNSLGAVFVLGITVSALEFATALPYLGAIGLLLNAALSTVQWLAVLAAYNVILVLPPLLILAAYLLLGERVQARLTALRDSIQNGSRETFQWIIGIIGFLLLADALRYAGEIVYA